MTQHFLRNPVPTIKKTANKKFKLSAKTKDLKTYIQRNNEPFMNKI